MAWRDRSTAARIIGARRPRRVGYGTLRSGWREPNSFETWSRALHAAGGEIIIPVLDAQIEAADGDAKEALARVVDAHRAREFD